MTKKVIITVEQEPIKTEDIVIAKSDGPSGIEASHKMDVQISYCVSYGEKFWTDVKTCSYDMAQSVWDSMLGKACKIAAEETSGLRE